MTAACGIFIGSSPVWHRVQESVAWTEDWIFRASTKSDTERPLRFISSVSLR